MRRIAQLVLNKPFAIIAKISSILGILFSFQNCTKHDASVEPNSNSSLSTAAQEREITEKAINVLATNCSQCHNPSQPDGNIADILDTQALVSDGHIIEGSPQTSPLYLLVVDEIEPRNNSTLSEIDKYSLRDWITLLGGISDTLILPPEVDEEGNPLPPGTYQDVAQVIRTNCINCHDTQDPTLNNYAQVLATVTPGSATGGRLYNALIRMPNGNPLGFASAEARIIRTWINAGAANN